MQEGHRQAGDENDNREEHEDRVRLALPAVRVELLRIHHLPPASCNSFFCLTSSIEQVDSVELLDQILAISPAAVGTPHFICEDLLQY